MSVFQNRYTVEYIDGTLEYNVDMGRFIKQYGLANFKWNCGTNLKKNRISWEEYHKLNWVRQNHVITENVQISERYSITTIYWLYSCKFIVVDGFGRAVHPTVFIDAFLEMYPVKDKHLSRWSEPRWDESKDGWRVFNVHNYVPGSKPGWNRGRRYRNSKGAKQAMIRYTDNRRMTQYLEEPKCNVSYSDAEYVMNITYWDDGIRHMNETRNWKKYRKTQYKQR